MNTPRPSNVLPFPVRGLAIVDDVLPAHGDQVRGDLCLVSAAPTGQHFDPANRYRGCAYAVRQADLNDVQHAGSIA